MLLEQSARDLMPCDFVISPTPTCAQRMVGPSSVMQRPIILWFTSILNKLPNSPVGTFALRGLTVSITYDPNVPLIQCIIAADVVR